MANNNSTHQPEAFSRVLIDRALSDSGWDLLKPQQVQYVIHIAGINIAICSITIEYFF